MKMKVICSWKDLDLTRFKCMKVEQGKEPIDVMLKNTPEAYEAAVGGPYTFIGLNDPEQWWWCVMYNADGEKLGLPQSFPECFCEGREHLKQVRGTCYIVRAGYDSSQNCGLVYGTTKDDYRTISYLYDRAGYKSSRK